MRLEKLRNVHGRSDVSVAEASVIRAIRFYGLGKLGLPLASLFASAGLRVFGIDTDRDHVEVLRSGGGRFDEPGLTDLLQTASDWLTVRSEASAESAEATIIHVPTPSDRAAPHFSSSSVEEAIESACRAALAEEAPSWPHLIVVASTVMPGTFRERLEPLVRRHSGTGGDRFVLSYVPDFVAIGDVIRGFRRPPALLVGADDAAARDMTLALYARVVGPDVPRASVSLAEAELAKIASNFFFCMKIDFGNLLGRLAHGSGAIDADKVVAFLSLDNRIGGSFLKAGMPFGGPCFPRDVDAMVALCAQWNTGSQLAVAVRDSNEAQLAHLVRLVVDLGPHRVGVLGLSFKRGTSVTTQSPSFALIKDLVSRGIGVAVHDASEEACAALKREAWAGPVAVTGGLDDLCRVSDVIVVAVDEPHYGDLAAKVPADRTIIDPWGRVRGPHPGLILPGRQ